MKTIMIICALLVCQAHSADCDEQSAKLEKIKKSRRISVRLRHVQDNYQECCGFGDELKLYMQALIQCEDNFDVFCEQTSRKCVQEVQNYTQWMRDMIKHTQEFLTSYNEWIAAEEMIVENLCYHSKEDWGAFPNPTKAMALNCCTYLHRNFLCRSVKRLFLGCQTVQCVFDGVITRLKELSNLQKDQQSHLSLLEKAVVAIGEDENIVTQTYKKLTIAHINHYRILDEKKVLLQETVIRFLDLRKRVNLASVEKVLYGARHV
ncbi:MAG: hypothetical protein OXC30_01130 [Alphaproteobacteria bacterium]|nr:hypothetical protein [Alphaproteobacteria bacterium]